MPYQVFGYACSICHRVFHGKTAEEAEALALKCEKQGRPKYRWRKNQKLPYFDGTIKIIGRSVKNRAGFHVPSYIIPAVKGSATLNIDEISLVIMTSTGRS